MGRLRNFNFSSTWIVLLISGQSGARRGQLNSNLLPTYPAGNLAKMENEAGIDTKKSLHRWGISVCADICCKIKIILIALKNGEVKTQSVMGKRGQAGSPPDKQPHPLFLLPFSSPPPTLPSAFLPLSISFGKIHTLTKRMLSSAETQYIYYGIGK